MKKTVSILSLFVLIVLVFNYVVLSAKAHSGRTDGSGGHTDHGSGEYHYHHGHPAHDHYDMDGDGIIDCPYEFDDQTKSNNGVISNDSSTPVTLPSILSTTREEYKEDRNVPSWIYWVIGGEAFLIVFLFLSNKLKKEEILDLENYHQANMKSMQDSYEKKIENHFSAIGELDTLYDQIASAKKELEKVDSIVEKEYAELGKTKQERICLKQAPLDVSFAEDGMPIYWKPNPVKPYGDYTVYINVKSGIYHVDRFCSSYCSREDHVFNVIGHARPCKKCAEGFFDFATVPDWFVSKEALIQTSIFDDPTIKVNWRDQ